MVTYIKKDIKGAYYEVAEALSNELYDNLGSTYQDYLSNKWVMLNDEQLAFKQEHPHASVKEVFEMVLKPEQERTIADAKQSKINEILDYDISENVNSFIVNETITTWFTVEERLNYKQSIEAAKLMSIEKLSFFIGDIKFDIVPELAEQMLAMIQLYADQCFIVTKQHKLNVQALETIEEVDNYDFRSGYPEQLRFDLN